MRVLLDTNVLVAAVASRGLCAELLARVILEHRWLVTDGVRGELQRVLHEKFPRHEVASFLPAVTPGKRRPSAGANYARASPMRAEARSPPPSAGSGRRSSPWALSWAAIAMSFSGRYGQAPYLE